METTVGRAKLEDASLPKGSPPEISPFFSESLHNWDSQHSLWMHDWGLKIPRPFLQALEYSGDGLFWIPVATALCWAPVFTLQPFFKSLLIGFILDLFFIGTIKALFRRPRPVYNKGMYLVVSVDHYSFPSGHSSRAFLIFVFVLKYASEWKAMASQASGLFVEDLQVEIYIIPFLFACWATATASSRILLGRHFLLDVVAGSFLGILEAAFAIRFLLDLQFYLDNQQRWLLESVQQAILNFF